MLQLLLVVLLPWCRGYYYSGVQGVGRSVSDAIVALLVVPHKVLDLPNISLNHHMAAAVFAGLQASMFGDRFDLLYALFSSMSGQFWTCWANIKRACLAQFQVVAVVVRHQRMQPGPVEVFTRHNLPGLAPRHAVEVGRTDLDFAVWQPCFPDQQHRPPS